MNIVYDIQTLEELEENMKQLKEHSPEMYEEFTVKEIVEDAVNAWLVSPEVANEYLEKHGE
jgi:hypothetical protein